MNRRDFVRYSSSLLAASAVTGPLMGEAPPRPNIVLILADDLGYNDLACYGGPEVQTPNIDKLASEGVRFTRMYAASSACTPSRASLLTGRCPQRNGMDGMNGDDNGIDAREILLPQLLKKAGYKTACVGKWNLGRRYDYHPSKRGFDLFFGTMGNCDYYFHTSYGKEQLYRNQELIKEDGVYLTDLLKREALSFIESSKADPFFLYFAPTAPHFPSNSSKRMQAPKESLDRYGKRPVTNRVAYMAAVSSLDDAVGALRAKLEEFGILDNTLILFTSDNGGDIAENDSDNYPLRGGKASVFEGGLRVPGIVRWPAAERKGVADDRLATFMDYFPTILEAAGVKLPKDLALDGASLMPVLKGVDAVIHKELYFKQARNGFKAGVYPKGDHPDRALISGDWKLVHPCDTEKPMLFNVKNDPAESCDFALTRPEILRNLEKAYAAWEADMAHWPPRLPYCNDRKAPAAPAAAPSPATVKPAAADTAKKKGF